MEENKKILVIFGSQSDHEIYDEVVGFLANKGVEYDLKVASAHKSPDLVDEIIEKGDYGVIIAGAGLAAALPGVVAAKTIVPVIGLPCTGNYQGLDALLSIMQMPPGVPVMSVGINKTEVAAKNAIMMSKIFPYVNIIGDSEHRKVKRAIEIMQRFENEYKVSSEIDMEAVNIKFFNLGDPIKEEDALVIYCAIDDNAKNSTAEAALNMMKLTETGLWVGLNNSENAAIAAIEVMNYDGKNLEEMGYYRRDLKKKIMEANVKKEGEE